MSHTIMLRWFVLLALLLSANNGFCKSETLQVGVYECPPFVIKNDDGSFSGLSAMLWQLVADNSDLDYTFTEHTLDELINGVAKGDLDAGTSCISITPERERILDFSHSYFETHLAIAIKKGSMLATIAHVFKNRKFLIILVIGFVSACVIGGIFYVLEHHINEKIYSTESTGRKITEGFILGLLFITKGPFNYYEFRTLTGRVLTVFIAVLSTFFLASFTAILATSFTLGLLSQQITSPHDLVSKSVGAKAHTTSSKLLDSYEVIHQRFSSNEELVEALSVGKVEAIVADDAVLKYQIKMGQERGVYKDLVVLPYRFEKQNYGLVLKENSPHLEVVNQQLLEVRRSPVWNQELVKFFNDK